jgi:hypothetical protein
MEAIVRFTHMELLQQGPRACDTNTGSVLHQLCLALVSQLAAPGILLCGAPHLVTRQASPLPTRDRHVPATIDGALNSFLVFEGYTSSCQGANEPRTQHFVTAAAAT